MRILDLFAGPGGWDEGLRLLGRDDVVGIEMDKDACATAEAAGHQRIKADVTKVSTADFHGIEGLIASPPCQTFSDAGKGEGVGSLDDLAEALLHVARGAECSEAAGRAGLDSGDPRSTLILEPMRFVRDLLPSWVAFEEVPPVLPVWRTYAAILHTLGYSAWSGILNAADYGIPQSRKRAFLLASRDGQVGVPPVTHTRNGQLTFMSLDLKPWVTMAEALDLGPRVDDLTAWAWDRPATTVVRSFRPDVISAPGYRTVGDPSRQNAPGSITVTDTQMCVLQGIRTDYPFQGSPTKRKSLIGAILPPPWAAAILEPLLGTAVSTCGECGNDQACMGFDYCSDCLEEVS